MPKYDLSLKMQFLLKGMNLVRGRSTAEMSLEEIQNKRKDLPRNLLINWVLGKPIKLYKVYNRLIPVRDAEIPVRFYIPSDQKNLPVILNYHGGGWVVGNLQQSDYYCSQVALKTAAIVISVDYRLAPEFPFPVPAQDAYDALVWASKNASTFGGDSNRLGVTGDSAGGNLAAVVTLMSRDLGGPKIAFQALIYPATDGTFNFPSYTIHTNAPILSQAELNYYRDTHESKKGDHLNPYFSPALANDHSDLPPGIVLTAGYDPLLDDGRLYTEKLNAAGVDVEWVNYEKDIHGFICFPNHTMACKPAIEKISQAFKEAFTDGPC